MKTAKVFHCERFALYGITSIPAFNMEDYKITTKPKTCIHDVPKLVVIYYKHTHTNLFIDKTDYMHHEISNLLTNCVIIPLLWLF